MTGADAENHQQRWAEEDQPQRREDAADGGKEDLQRRAGCFRTNVETSFDAHLRRVRSDRASDRDAGPLCMDDRTDQRREVFDTGGHSHLFEGFGSRAAQLDLAERARNEQRERALLMTDQLLEGPIQAEARLHTDRDDIESVWQGSLDFRASCTDQLVEPQDREVEADGNAYDQKHRDPYGRAHQQPEDCANGPQCGRRRNPERLNAGGVQPQWRAGEVELSLKVRGLRGGRETLHSSPGPAAQRGYQALTKWLLQLEGDRALAQAELLAGEPLTSQRGSIDCARASDSQCDPQCADSRQHADKDGQHVVHAIAVIRRMMTFPIASRPAASPSITQPIGLTNIGRK